MSREHYDVVIVGYGPTGASLANLLGPSGLAVLVIERDPAPLPLPRAVHFDGEVMRIFQTMGLAERLVEHVRPSGGMRYYSPAGDLLLERQPAKTPGPHGWMQNYLFHQPYLEATLREGVTRFANVEVRSEREVIAIETSASEVRVTMRSREGVATSVTAAYVVGCDGARSIVRTAMGVEHDDLGLHQPWLVVDVKLNRPLPALPTATVQYCEPARPTTFVNVVGDRRRWEIMLMPGDDPATIAEQASVERLLARWLAPGDAEIERRAVYTFHSLIAQRWRVGRLLLAGDAAHQTPPFLGQGMCAGIRDAANLGWKLARVLRARAGEALLDTYASEREPHVRQFVELAVRLGNIIQTTDPAVAEARDRRFREGGKEELVNLSPPLGPGLHLGALPAGEIFPQPRTDAGQPIDALIGDAFAVIGDATTIAQVSARTRSSWSALGARVIDEPGDAARHWLGMRALAAVILRPDRYIAAAAHDAAELETQSARIAAQLYSTATEETTR